MKDLIKQCSMVQLISKSTHRADHILDWVVVKKDYKAVENVAVLDHLLSDHCSIIIDLDVKKAIPINRYITSRNLKGIDMDQLRSDLRVIRIDDINLYNNELKVLIDKHPPLVTRGVSDRPYTPWHDTDVKSAKCECQRAERLQLKTGLTVHNKCFFIKNQQWKLGLRPLKRIITCLNLEIHVLVNNFLEYVMSFWVDPSSLGIWRINSFSFWSCVWRIC